MGSSITIHKHEDSLDTHDYLRASIFSLCCAVANLVLLNCGVYKTFLNKTIVRERGLLIFFLALYFLVLSLTSPGEKACQTWGLLLGYLWIANQVSFALLTYDLYSVFRQPFRSLKFAKYRSLYPHIAAFILIIPLWVENDYITYRDDFGQCWVKSQGGQYQVNPYNWLMYFFPTFGQMSISILCFLYIAYHMQMQKKLFCQEWQISKFLGISVW